MNAIQIENIWKEYRLGVIGHKMISKDLQSWWATVRKKEDPNAKISPLLNGQEKQVDGNHFWALRDINLEIKEGEILGIIGKNGAGKSTLLKLLSRVTAPTRGQIKVRGRIASLLEVGTGFHPELTGRENIFLNGAIMGMEKPEIAAKLDEIIEFSGVDQHIDTPVKRYSSGMYVRLAFSVAAHMEPEILVVDEVLAVGDAEFQKKCLGKMGEVSQKGRTVIFVSHNMGSINQLCNRGVVLENGMVYFEGDISQTINTYLDNCQQEDAFNRLSNRDASEGGKKFRFTDAALVDVESGKEINSIISGRDVALKIKYDTAYKVGDKVDLGISFRAIDGTVLFTCRSSVTNTLVEISNNHTTTCVIPRFPLKPGKYYINLIAFRQNSLVDQVQEARSIHVEYSEFFPSGDVPAALKSGVLVDYKWC